MKNRPIWMPAIASLLISACSGSNDVGSAGHPVSGTDASTDSAGGSSGVGGAPGGTGGALCTAGATGGGAYGGGGSGPTGACATGGAAGVGAIGGAAGVGALGGDAGTGGAGAGCSVAEAGVVAAPDGSDCAPPKDMWCEPGCIRVNGHACASDGCYHGERVLTCVRSCVDGAGAVPLPRRLSDGRCVGLARVCTDWADTLAVCPDPPPGCMPGGPVVQYVGFADGGAPCELADPFSPRGVAPLHVARREQDGTQTELLERASITDCGSRDGYFVDWSSGAPKITLCPVTCSAAAVNGYFEEWID